MSDKHSTTEKLLVRRRFLASAVATGAGLVCATDVLANTNNLDTQTCGELTAADPLYLYASLVTQLQPAAIVAARKVERIARKSLSDKLEELWTLSDDLKLKLSRQSKIQSTVDRMSTLAKIGRTNARAVDATLHSKSAELSHANLATQNVITQEIVKTSLDLSQQGEKTLKADEWKLLQKLLVVINDIKTIYQPAAVMAGEKFDEFIEGVSTNILGIQTSLMDASRHVVLGEKAQAQKKIRYALAELKRLPSDQQPGNENQESLTRDGFVAMIEPILGLISSGSQRLPQVSHHRRGSFAAMPLAMISAEEIFLPNAIVNSSTVRSIVRSFFRSGNWWQVIGVTAACLPLWIAYGQTLQRLSLIRSAISAVPRGRGTDLEGAADALNRLTS